MGKTGKTKYFINSIQDRKWGIMAHFYSFLTFEKETHFK